MSRLVQSRVAWLVITTLALALVILTWPDTEPKSPTQFSRQQYDLIQLGMSRERVRSIFACPPGWYGLGEPPYHACYHEIASFPSGDVEPDVPNIYMHWHSDRSWISVFFVRGWVVQKKWYVRIPEWKLNARQHLPPWLRWALP
jgi:hypothetical protein